MATQVFLLDTVAEAHRGTNTAKLDGTTSGWNPLRTGTARGDTAGFITAQSNTVLGATNGVEAVRASFPVEWLTPPIDQDVTISGAITGNIWAAENNMSANVAINFVVDKIAATDGTITQIVKSARVTEVAVTTATVNNFTATPGAGVACNKGDRLRIRIFGDDAGVMASGFTFDVNFDSNTAATNGDTFVTFTETFGFQTTTPTGTIYYLGATTSDVATADVDRALTQTAPTGAGTATVNTAAGWTARIQLTDSAGGTAVTWWSPRLSAFTLTGLVRVELHAASSATAANASIGAELARVDADGSNPTVWAFGLKEANADASLGEVNQSASQVKIVWLAGDDLALTDGQRLRLRIYIDDCADVPLVTGQTVALSYNNASFDSLIRLEQTVTEFTPATPSLGLKRKDPGEALRDFDPWSVTGWM